MQAIPTIPLIGAGVWLVGCLSIAGLIWLRRGGKHISRDYALMAAGMVTLAFAPSASLVGYVLGDVAFAGGIGVVVAIALFVAALAARRERLSNSSSFSGRTFQEKSAALVAVTLCIVFAGYFLGTWNAPFAVALGALVGSVIIIVIVQIIGHILLALTHAPLEEIGEVPDERHKEVELYSIRNSYRFLVFVFWAIPLLAIVAEPLTVARTAIAIIVVAEVAYYGSIVAYYRFGST